MDDNAEVDEFLMTRGFPKFVDVVDLTDVVGLGT